MIKSLDDNTPKLGVFTRQTQNTPKVGVLSIKRIVRGQVAFPFMDMSCVTHVQQVGHYNRVPQEELKTGLKTDVKTSLGTRLLITKTVVKRLRR